MSTLARQLGFSSTVVGTMYTVLSVIGMLAKPTFGAIADRFQRQKLFFLLFQLLTVAFFAIMFIPAIPQPSLTTLSCNSDAQLVLEYCPGDAGEPIKECVVANIHRNQSLSCDLVCESSTAIGTSICAVWNVPLWCSGNQSASSMQIVIESNLLDFKVSQECLNIKISSGLFPETNEWPNFSCSPGQIFTQCTTKCNHLDVNSIITAGKIPDNQLTGHYQFWLFFLCMALSWIGMAVVVSVGDAICFEMLGQRPHMYGNQRMWGAIGWGIVALLAGTLVDAFSKGKTYKDYSVLFYLMLILMVMDMLVSKKLNYKPSKSSANILKDVGKLFTSFRVVLFLAWCIVVGLGTALIWNFLFWHLEELAAADDGCDYSTWIKTLQGLTSAVQCFAGDLPFFFLSGWILDKIGHIHAMSLILAGFGVRFFLYSLLRNPWLVLPIELLNGVTFGLFHSTMASYATIVAPPGTDATIQVSSNSGRCDFETIP